MKLGPCPDTDRRRPTAIAEPLEARRLASAARPLRLGVLGDSYSDEYRFYPPDRSHAANWVQLLAHNRRASFGAFTTRSRGGPRGQGYADDWAQSGATSGDLPAQTAGVAAQAAAGQVDVATILIGGNDFLDLLASAAADPATNVSTATAAVATTEQAVVANLESAVATVLAASPTVRVAIATLPPVSALPLVAATTAGDAALTTLVTAIDAAEAQVNASIKAFAATDTARVAVADFAAAAASFDAPTYAVGRFAIDTAAAGNKPRDLFVADGIHIGTVAQALLADTFVATINASFGQSIKPLTTRQVVVDAGLAR